MSSTLLRQLDVDHVWHPFTPMQYYAEDGPPIITAGAGFYLFDAEGRRFLDGVSSLWCNVHGHRVPEIDQAIRDQLDRIAHSTLLGLGSEASILLAAELVRRAPTGLRRVFYSDSGASAVEIAIKLAFQYYRQRGRRPEQRDLYIRLDGAYHGDTLGAASLGGVERFRQLFEPLLFPSLKIPAPVAFRTPAGQSADQHLRWCYDEVERVLTQHAGRVAAVVVEPRVQAAAGMLVHPPDYLTYLREATRRHDVLLIADEVAVGFAKTGALFACDLESVTPDFLCLAKGLTGGYLPVGATLATEEIYQAFWAPAEDFKTFFHGHTYTGNALGCAAALASLRLIDANDVLGNAAQLAASLRQQLAPLADHPHVGEIRQQGVMVGIELVADRTSQSAFQVTRFVGRSVCQAARRRGVFIRPLGDVIVLMPAPAMPPPLAVELCQVVGDAIDETCRP